MPSSTLTSGLVSSSSITCEVSSLPRSHRMVKQNVEPSLRVLLSNNFPCICCTNSELMASPSPVPSIMLSFSGRPLSKASKCCFWLPRQYHEDQLFHPVILIMSPFLFCKRPNGKSEWANSGMSTYEIISRIGRSNMQTMMSYLQLLGYTRL